MNKASNKHGPQFFPSLTSGISTYPRSSQIYLVLIITTIYDIKSPSHMSRDILMQFKKEPQIICYYSQ
jgi:hypothetical protein